MTETEIAFRAAINVLRDSVESPADALGRAAGGGWRPAAHARAADHTGASAAAPQRAREATAMNELAVSAGKTFGVIIETARLRLRPRARR